MDFKNFDLSQLKKQPLEMWIYIITVLFAIIGMIWLVVCRVLPSFLLWIFLFIEIVFFVVLYYLLINQEIKWLRTAGYIVAGCLIALNCIQSIYLATHYVGHSESSGAAEKQGDFVDLYVLKSSVIYDGADLNRRTIGYLTDMNAGQLDLMKEWIASQNVECEFREYDSSLEMVTNLKGAVIDGMILYQPYLAGIENYPGMENLNEDLRSVAQIPCEPISGSENSAAESGAVTVAIAETETWDDISVNAETDAAMILSINPDAHEALIISVPKNTFALMNCPAEAGCPAGQDDLLADTGFYGLSTTVATMEKLLDFNVDYSMKVNNSTVSELVSSIGGIDISNTDDPVNGYYFRKGNITLYGGDAVNFGSEGYVYGKTDQQQAKNQAKILSGILQKLLSQEMISQLPDLFSSLSYRLETDIPVEQVTEFAQSLQNDPAPWTIYSYVVTGTDSTDFSPVLNSEVPVLIPDDSSIQRARQDLQALGMGEKPLHITYEAAVNEVQTEEESAEDGLYS